MKNYFIIANYQKNPCMKTANYLCRYLQENGMNCSVQDSQDHTDPGRIPAQTECVLVLGGDGTLLRAARDLVNLDIPLLGINMGTLGYLAEIESEHAVAAVNRLITGDYTLEKRMMIEGRVIRDGQNVLGDIALNDIVISRHGRLRVLDFRISVNDAFLCDYRSDGIIIATATGSTGYSLSAGGPIVSPDANLMLLTPVAPHTMGSRTIVLPSSVRICIEVCGREFLPDDGADAAFDGDTICSLRVGDKIIVNRALRQTTLVKINHTSFVEILRNKMN